MKIAICGTYHLGAVIFSGLIKAGHDTILYEHLGNKQFEGCLKEPKIFVPSCIISDPYELKDCDIIWIAFDVLLDDNCNPKLWEFIGKLDTIFSIKRNNEKIIILSSQVPISMGSLIINRYDLKEYYYIPENLRIGNAYSYFLNQDRIVVGYDKQKNNISRLEIIKDLLSFFSNRVIITDLLIAEFSKNLTNCLLAHIITFVNEMQKNLSYNFPEMLDFQSLNEILSSDERFNKIPVKYGLPFSGNTLIRDVKYLLKEFSFSESIKNILNLNELQKERILNEILNNVNMDSFILIEGLSYKSGSNIINNSFALEVCKFLLEKTKNIYGHDNNITNADWPFFLERYDSLFDYFSSNKEKQKVIILFSDENIESLESYIESKCIHNLVIVDFNNFLKEHEGVKIIR